MLEMVRHVQEIGMILIMQVVTMIIGVAFVVGAPIVIYIYFIKKPYPGVLKKMGEYETEDPCNEADKQGRRRDFARIVASEGGLWVYTPNNEKETLLPIKCNDVHSKSGVDQCYEDFKQWLKDELNSIPGGTWSGGRALGWPVIDRVVNLVSVSPEFEFLRRHKVAPRAMQAKYVLMISKSGQVRVAWYAFVADSIKPGMKSGPFVVKLCSEDLNRDRMSSWSVFQYSCLPTTQTQMEAVIHEQTHRLKQAIETDNWPNFYKDFS